MKTLIFTLFLIAVNHLYSSELPLMIEIRNKNIPVDFLELD